MIWKGKEISRWQIPTTSMEHYKEVFNKLRALGFVFGGSRDTDADAIISRSNYGFPVLVIGYEGYGENQYGTNPPCKMKLNGYRKGVQKDYQTITVDDWIANCWPAYDAA